jgi:hypothetical protein
LMKLQFFGNFPLHGARLEQLIEPEKKGFERHNSFLKKLA